MDQKNRFTATKLPGRFRAHRKRSALRTDVNICSCSWGVIVAHRQRWAAVSSALSERDIEHFVPLIETLTIKNGRHCREKRPLFGDYILTTIFAKWRSLLSIRGVRGFLVNESGLPAQVVPNEIARLRNMCDGENFRCASQNDISGFEYGQRVTPKSGPLAYQIGRFESRTRTGESAIFVMFGREQKVKFKKGELLAV